jgi:hypothetical protein
MLVIGLELIWDCPTSLSGARKGIERESNLEVGEIRAGISTHTILSFNDGVFGEGVGCRGDSGVSEYIEKAFTLGDALR